jgi:hypothetical protein
MEHMMRLALALAFALTTLTVHADENLAVQMDAVAPILASGKLEELGGPDTHEAIVEGIDGRWFTLKNTARNWEGSGSADRERLARSIERTCSDSWENILTYEVIAPGAFIAAQRTPAGVDKGTFEIQPAESGMRTFRTLVDDDYFLGLLDLEGADAAKKEAELSKFRDLMNKGFEIWRPTPDLLIISRVDDFEIWGRCP